RRSFGLFRWIRRGFGLEERAGLGRECPRGSIQSLHLDSTVGLGDRGRTGGGGAGRRHGSLVGPRGNPEAGSPLFAFYPRHGHRPGSTVSCLVLHPLGMSRLASSSPLLGMPRVPRLAAHDIEISAKTLAGVAALRATRSHQVLWIGGASAGSQINARASRLTE